MKPDRWQRIQTLFLGARELPEAKRASWLAENCGSDTGLRSEVESLLAHDTETGTLVRPPGVEGDLGPTTQDPDTVGTAVGERRIGRYEVLRVIASGGMGTVYEAAQDQPHRLVALKVLRRGAASRNAMKRFQHEAEILGRLRHPNIAQIHDAGTFDTGEGAQPYFAMELVKGLPLVQYCQSKELGTRNRLELFVKVCDAVQFAHHKGVIHRDLKPDNILVDDFGEPKILDFGVARATDADLQITTLRTDMGQLIGTVPYMSPEQVTGDPSELDTRSDVYSLGVVLYELMCGQLPYDLKGKNIPEAVRVIREDDPTPLSSINRTHRGDVETIVTRALEKEKDRRYQTAAELAADIRRYLKDEPILARPASTFYQLRKFGRRHKALVGGVAATFAALALGTVVATWQAVQARAEADKSGEINEFLMKLLALANPIEDLDDLADAGWKGRALTVAELIDEASDALATSFSDWPEVKADLYSRLGMTYWGLGRHDDMRSHLERAYELQAETLGEDDPVTLVTLVWWASAVEDVSYPKACAMYRRAADGLARICKPHDRRTLSANLRLANILFYMGQYEESERHFRDTIDIARRHLGLKHKTTLRAVSQFGFTLLRARRLQEAEELVGEALEVSRLSLPEGDLVTAGLVRILGNSILAQGRPAEALPFLQEAYEWEHRDSAGVTKNALRATFFLARTLRDLDRAPEGEAIIKKKVEDCRRELGEDHEFTLWAVFDLGDFLRTEEKLDEAEALLRQAREHFGRALGEENFYVLMAMWSLGLVLRDQERLDEAELVLKETLDGLRRFEGEDDGYAVNVTDTLAVVLHKQGRNEEALAQFEQVAAARRESAGEEHWFTAMSSEEYGLCLLELERYEDAETVLQTTYVGFRDLFGKDHERTRSALTTLVDLYEAWGKPEKAAEYRALLREAEGVAAPD